MLKLFIKTPMALTQSKDYVLPIIRISIGLFFLTTGYNKLFVEKNQQVMLETITSAGIPFPSISSVLVSGMEFGLGILLVIGLFTHLSSILLLVICLVALFTVGIYTIPLGIDLITWISWFFYIHDLLYIFLILVIISNKPDRLTIDRKLCF